MTATIDAAGGFASLPLWRRNGTSYLRGEDEPGRDPSTALMDLWLPPHPMSLPVEMCERVQTFAVEECRPIDAVAAAMGTPTTRAQVTAYVVGVHREPGAPERVPVLTRCLELNPGARIPSELLEAVVQRVKAANAQWWTFDVDHFTLIVKRYENGGDHPAHMDWTPDGLSQGRKLAASIPLNDPSEYEGGRFVAHRITGATFAEVPIPQDRGGMVMFPPWLAHEVTPVTAGERWVLLLNAWGDRLR